MLAVPILVLMLVAANLVIPQDNQRVLHVVEMMLAPLELGLLTFLVLKVRSVRKAYRKAGAGAEDFLETFEEVLSRNVDAGRPGKMIATEIAMIYYGLYGMEKKFQRLSLAMDDLPAFVKALDVGE